jgi:hypothetical protein
VVGVVAAVFAVSLLAEQPAASAASNNIVSRKTFFVTLLILLNWLKPQLRSATNVPALFRAFFAYFRLEAFTYDTDPSIRDETENSKPLTFTRNSFRNRMFLISRP